MKVKFVFFKTVRIFEKNTLLSVHSYACLGKLSAINNNIVFFFYIKIQIIGIQLYWNKYWKLKHNIDLFRRRSQFVRRLQSVQVKSLSLVTYILNSTASDFEYAIELNKRIRQSKYSSFYFVLLPHKDWNIN